MITRQIFIDANIFTYVLTGHPIYGRSCQELLEKVENNDIDAFISPLVIDEVSYILMVQKAKKTADPREGKLIKQTMFGMWEDCLEAVSEFYGYLDQLISVGSLKVLSLDYSISRISIECARNFRLLPRDALHVACCKAYDIKEMATNDRDLERVDFLKLWKPSR